MVLINIQPQGKNFHVWFRNKDGKKTYKFITNFKPYFYYSLQRKSNITYIDDVEIKYVSIAEESAKGSS